MLIVAERRGPVRMSELAAFCGLNPTMLSRMVPRLEGAGLLSRGGEPGDRRAVLVEATEDARSLLEAVRNERDEVLSGLLDALDQSERAALVAATPALEKLAERVREMARPEARR